MPKQPRLFDFARAPLSAASVSEIARFRRWRIEESRAAKATTDSECSQLRSLARASEGQLGLTLSELLGTPAVAASLIEETANGLTVTTIQTRVRAFQHFLQLGVSPFLGRQRIRAFLSGLPSRESRGWYDVGVSVPGSRQRKRMPVPTPPPELLATIVERAVARSDLDAALACMACFSGLEMFEIAQLRWRDLVCRDDGADPFWEVRVSRDGKGTSCFILGPGTRPLMRYALKADRSREAFVLPGRRSGTGLSTGAAKARLAMLYIEVGWPGLSRWQLKSAFAEWLRRRGIDDHDIRMTLGLRRVATVDSLLQPYNRLAAQQQIDAKVFPQR